MADPVEGHDLEDEEVEAHRRVTEEEPTVEELERRRRVAEEPSPEEDEIKRRRR